MNAQVSNNIIKLVDDSLDELNKNAHTEEKDLYTKIIDPLRKRTLEIVNKVQNNETEIKKNEKSFFTKYGKKISYGLTGLSVICWLFSGAAQIVQQVSYTTTNPATSIAATVMVALSVLVTGLTAGSWFLYSKGEEKGTNLYKEKCEEIENRETVKDLLRNLKDLHEAKNKKNLSQDQEIKIQKSFKECVRCIDKSRLSKPNALADPKNDNEDRKKDKEESFTSDELIPPLFSTLPEVHPTYQRFRELKKLALKTEEYMEDSMSSPKKDETFTMNKEDTLDKSTNLPQPTIVKNPPSHSISIQIDKKEETIQLEDSSGVKSSISSSHLKISDLHRELCKKWYEEERTIGMQLKFIYLIEGKKFNRPDKGINRIIAEEDSFKKEGKGSQPEIVIPMKLETPVV